MKKIISIIVTIVMILSCVSMVTLTAAAAAPKTLAETPDFQLADSNKNIALYLNYISGEFALMNLKTGTIWYSNPIDRAEDKYAEGDTAEELNSQISVTYLNSSYSVQGVSSLDSSIVFEHRDNDWIMTFYFNEYFTNFSIPVMLSLKEDYLHVEVLIDKIVEMGDSRVLTVELFEFFGAANTKDKGYCLLPDGSGSLMELNEQVLIPYEFGVSGEGAFYDNNPTEVASQSYFTNLNEPLRLPVYGMVRNGEAFLNIIESGAAISNVHAYVSKYKNGYNAVYSVVSVRDTQTRRTVTGSSGTGNYYSEEIPENYVSRIYFLDKDESNYVGMAKQYREYLINELGMDKVDSNISNSLCVALYGAVKYQTHFLGIPYTGVKPLTTYSEAEELVDRLVADGIDKAYINYTGWASGGLETTMSDSFDLNSKLGGKKAAKKLIDKVNENDNYFLSFDLDLQSFFGNNGKIKKFRSTAYGLDAAPVTVFKARISAAGALDKNSISNQLIHPAFMPGYSKSFMDDASKYGVTSYSFNTIGETLYCAYNFSNIVTRDDSAKIMSEIYKNANEFVGENGIISTKGGNGYAVPYVDNVVDSPVYASHNNLALQDVPFYQLVFRGFTNLAGPAINLDSEENALLLKLAETGTSLYYLLMDADSTSFQETNFTASYACELDDHYDSMIKNYKRLKVVYDAIEDSTIEDHKIVNDTARITIFENGAKVYVNYGDDDAMIGGVSVPANDFVVVGGANS